MKNVCLFGDSIAKGVSFDDLSGRYTILKNNFATLTADTLGVILNNKAKFGCTIRKGQEVISRIISNKSEDSPIDYALLEFGGNDCDFKWKEIASNPDAEHLPNTPIPEFIGIYEDIIRDLQANSIIPVVLTLPPLVADSYFRWFSRDIPQKENILAWLGGDVEAIYYWHERYNSAVWEVASHMNCHIIDIRKAFLEQKNHRRFVCTDGIHLNQAGHELVYSVILRDAAEYPAR
ncbi:MAG: SGNH/GDSL hydrolase family protein [Saccharofermentanales bacterium]